MISAEENKLLMEVGPGTLMGELMRRYWMPLAAQSELDDLVGDGRHYPQPSKSRRP